ncbi:MAG: PAS domain S-box protein, partial [Hydrogenophaga sp.]
MHPDTTPTGDSSSVLQPELDAAFFRVPIGIAMALTDRQGRILECNDAFCSMLGYTRAELTAMELGTVIYPDDRPRNRQLLDQLMRREVSHFELEKRYVTKVGGIVWCRVHVASASSQSAKAVLRVVEDITPQRLAEQRLQNNQLLLRMAGRLARLGGWTFDSAKQVLYWSDEVCEMHGHPLGYKPPLEAGIIQYAPEYQPMIERHLRECLTQGTPFDFEAELVRVGGQRLWVRAIGECTRDRAGTITGLQGALQDITLQRQHESERHALSTKLTATLEHMSDAFFTVDRDWTITYANEAMARSVGRAPAEVVGRMVWDLLPDARNSAFHRCYQQAIDTGMRATVVDYYAPLDRWYDMHAHPTDDGGVAVYFKDITQKRKDEAQL